MLSSFPTRARIAALSTLGTVVAFGAAAAPAAAHASAAPAVVAPVVVTRPVYVVADRREPHPEIRQAIVQLERARYDLAHAAHDFGGHRATAIQACDNAIAQLRLALQYDR